MLLKHTSRVYSILAPIRPTLRYGMTLLGLVSVIYLWYMAVYQSYTRSHLRTVQEISLAQKEYTTMRQQERTLAQLEHSLAQLQQFVKKYECTSEWCVMDIMRLFSSTPVQLRECSLLSQHHAQDPRIFSVTIDGSLDHLALLCEQLMHESKLVAFNNLSLTRSETQFCLQGQLKIG